VRKADNLATILCRCDYLGTLTSWNPVGHSKPVTGMLYRLPFTVFVVGDIFFLLVLQPPSGVVFYSPLVGFSLLGCEFS